MSEKKENSSIIFKTMKENIKLKKQIAELKGNWHCPKCDNNDFRVILKCKNRKCQYMEEQK